MSNATAGDTIELLADGSSFATPVPHTLTQAEIDAGSVTLTAGSLSEGGHDISVKLSDAAGNSTTSTALPVTIDDTPPNAPTIDSFAVDTEPYNFAINSLTVYKTGSDGQFVAFEDTFSGGPGDLPPPSAPDFTNGQQASYGTLGTFTEMGGYAIMDGSRAGFALGPSGNPFAVHVATLLSNINPDSDLGLKLNQDFTVEGRFALIFPDQVAEAYGIRLSDRLQAGTPSDQPGDDVIELVVRRIQTPEGELVVVQLAELDFVSGSRTPIGDPVVLDPALAGSEIVLRLTHEANTGEVVASFDVIDQVGNVVLTHEFENTGLIFNGEEWTRAQIVAYSPTGDNITADNTLLLTGTAEPGSAVTIYDGDTPIGTTAADPTTGAWSFQAGTNDVPLSDGEHVFTATATDAAGNTGPASAAINVTVDTTADAGTALALSAANPTGGATAAEVSITLSGIDPDIASGTITLSDGAGNTATHTLTPAEIAAIATTGSVTLGLGAFTGGDGFAALNHTDSLITVSASVTDDAGNTTGPSNTSFTLDTTADVAPALLLSAANPAGGATAAEVSITLSGIDPDIASGTITLSDGAGNTATHTLTPAEIAAIATTGSVTLGLGAFTGGDGFAALNHTDSLITVSASVTDDAGNTTGPSNTSFTLDTTADVAPALLLSAANPTGGATAAEVSITLSGIDPDIASGTITLSDGAGNTATHTLTPAEIAAIATTGSVTLGLGAFTGGDGFAALNHTDSLITVSASVTDDAGNTTGPSNTSFTLDTTADVAPALLLSAANPTGGATAAEVSITLSGIDPDIASGTITLSDGAGNTATHTLTPAEIAAIATTGSVTLGLGAFTGGDGFAALNHTDSLITVSASVTDDAGNTTGPSNTSFTLDTTADVAPALLLSAANPTGGATAAEVSITLSGIDPDIASGTITLSDGAGNTATHTLTPAEIAAIATTGSVTLGLGAFTGGDGFAALNHTDSLITVSASVTDDAGNTTGPSNTSFTLDTTADVAPALLLSAANPAGGATAAEVSITLSGIDPDIASGTITLSDGAGNTATHTLTPAEIAAIATTGSVTLGLGAFTGGDGFAALNHTDSLITVSASVTDDAGNTTGPSNTSFTLDTTADVAPALLLSAANPTGGATAAEVSITLSGIDPDIASGTITLSDGAGNTATHTLTPAEIAAIATTGSVTLGLGAFTGGDGFAALNHTDSLITVSASVTDDAGNTTGPSNTSFTLDTTADVAPALLLSAANPAGGATAAEVSITLSGIDPDIASGTITLSDGAGNTATHTLTPAEIAAIATTGSVTLGLGAFTGGDGFAALNHTDSLITVSASVTDDAGNTTGPSNTSFTLDTTADVAPALLLSAANPAGGATAAEVSITLSGIDPDIASGTITLSDGAGNTATHTLTPAEIAAIATTGSVTLGLGAFTGGDGFAALNHTDSLITVSASVTDDAGNTTGPSNTSFTLDTTADVAPALLLSAANPAGGATAAEVSITLSGIDPDIASGTITLSDGAGNTATHTLTPAEIAAIATTGSVTLGLGAFTGGDGFAALNHTDSLITVSASVTDDAGNTTGPSNTSFTLDTTAPTVTVDIVDASLTGGDNSSLVTFTFSEAPVGFAAGDITAVGGTVTDLTATADPLVYTATYTATTGFSGTGSVTVTEQATPTTPAIPARPAPTRSASSVASFSHINTSFQISARPGRRRSRLRRARVLRSPPLPRFQSNSSSYYAFNYSVDVAASTMLITYVGGVSWNTGSFNGFVITDVSNSLPDIIGVTDNSAQVTTTFDANNIYVNWQGQTLSPGQTILIEVTFRDPNDFDANANGVSPNGTALANNPLTLGNGGQTSFAGAGDDVVIGGNGVDTIWGGSGNDTINGGNGGDWIYGGSGNDTINGGNGADNIIGGYGADTLRGGDGAPDTFKFISTLDSTPATPDHIKDFSNEQIDLKAIDANTSTAALDAFTFVPNATPTTNPGVVPNSITWYQDTANSQTIVQGDVNGDSTADMVIVIDDVVSLTSSNFILS